MKPSIEDGPHISGRLGDEGQTLRAQAPHGRRSGVNSSAQHFLFFVDMSVTPGIQEEAPWASDDKRNISGTV
jgi:hypothetical protein